jgi:hypothetical protein
MKSLRTMTVFLMLGWIIEPAQAQILYGSLTGNVTDYSGSAIPGAKVDAINVATGIARQTVTDERGAYLINDLQQGEYKVTISAASFGTVAKSNVQLASNTVHRVDAQLELARLDQTITVDASTVTLQTDRGDVTTQISSAEIEDLPLPGSRNFQSLFELVPGSTPPAASHSEAGNPTAALAVNVNGASYNNNNTRIDGTSNLYPWLPEIIAYVPPADAIQAVSISTSSFDAEQGMAGGSAVNVSIKSGTNQLHGSLWEYNTISMLKARNFFYKGGPKNPKYILNQFGATFGGPIKRNKLFFFIDWERLDKRQAVSAFQTVPTDPFRAGNFKGVSTVIYDPTTGASDGSGRSPFPGNQIPTDRLNPAAVKMAALFPEPTQAGNSTNYFAVGHYYFTRDNIDAKVNYNPTSKSSIFARYSFSPYDIFDPPGLGAAGGGALGGGQPGHATGTVQNAAIGSTYTISPTVLMDGNVGYTRQSIGGKDIDINKNYGSEVLGIPGTNGSQLLQGGYPFFAVSGYSSFGNPNVSNPFVFRDNQYLAAVNLSWIKSNHSTRFGAETSRYGINHFQPQLKYGPRGGFNFSGGLTALKGGAASNQYNGWADFMLGMPQAMGKDYQYINPGTVRESSYGLFARDQWQVARKLTVNYGARYEYYPLATRDHSGFNRYDPTTNQVLLGGLGGVPYDTGVDNGHGQFAPRFGLAYRLTESTVIRGGYGISIDPNNFRVLRDAYPAVISQQINGVNSFQAAGSLTTGLPAVDFPDLNQGRLLFPATLGTSTYPQTIRRGYIESFNLTVQRQLHAGFNLEAGYVGTRSIRQFAHVNINAAGPGGGQPGRPLFALWGNGSDVNLIEPFHSASYNSLQTRLTKTLRRGSRIGANYTFSRAINYGDNSDSSLTWAWQPMWGRNKALAGYDRTHNFQLYGSYELPFGRARQLLTHGVLSSVAGGWQINGVMSRRSGSLFTILSSGTSVNAPGNTQTADQVLPEVAILGGHGSDGPYFNTKAFKSPTGVQFGNSGRDILRGPGWFNLDASIFRTFAVRERYKVQFRSEAFGATNTPRFNNPAATVTNGGFGTITGSSGERQLRFALKVLF